LSEITLKEYQEAFRELSKEKAKRGFVSHLIIYVVVNIGLIICNFVYSPTVLWFFWPLIFWGLGVLLHYLGAVVFIGSHLEKIEVLAEHRARKKKSQ